MDPLRLEWPALAGGRLLLCRHGQTEFNASMRFQGQHDVPLSEQGRREAAQLRERLAEESIDVAYSSDLSRARNTARTALGARDVPLHLDKRLREVQFGRWEGLTFAEIEERFPEDVALRQQDSVSFIHPGGESLVQLAERVASFFSDTLPRHAGQSVLLVAHGGTLNAAISVLLHVPLSAWWRLRNRNANLSIVRFIDAGPCLSTFNDVCHHEPLRT